MQKVIPGVNDLLSEYPSIDKEWNYQKNEALNPATVSSGSHKSVWWICKKGHNYEQAIDLHVSRKHGCPYCSGNKVLKGFNDLQTSYPDIAKEWNYEKNGNFLPTDFTAGSGKRIWWICTKGHSYIQKIDRRTRRGNACPYCSGHKVLKGYNDLATINPKLAGEWHPSKNGELTPYDVTSGSGKRVWWRCPIGHEYQARIHDRNSDNTQCPICNLRSQSSFPEQAVLYYVKKIYPDVISKYKEVFQSSMELDIYIPCIHVGIEFDGATWHQSDKEYSRELKKYYICKSNNIKLIRIKEETKRDWIDNAKTADIVYTIKTAKKLIELENIIRQVLDLIDLNSNMWIRTDPFAFHSKVSVNITRDFSQILSYLSTIEKSLESERPDVALKWNYEKNGTLKPSMFTTGSNQIVWWKCPTCGHTWQSTINSMTREGRNGCAECSKVHRGNVFIKKRLPQ